MTTHPSCRFGACPATGGRRRPRTPTPRAWLAPAIVALVAALGGCGQQGPLHYPWETMHEARDKADSRRVPTGARSELPSAADDASSTQVRP